MRAPSFDWVLAIALVAILTCQLTWAAPIPVRYTRQSKTAVALKASATPKATGRLSAKTTGGLKASAATAKPTNRLRTRPTQVSKAPASSSKPTRGGTFSTGENNTGDKICGIAFRGNIRKSCLQVGKELIADASSAKISLIQNGKASSGQQCDHIVELQVIRSRIIQADDAEALCERAQKNKEEWKSLINDVNNLHFVPAGVNRLKMMFFKTDVPDPMRSKDGLNAATAGALGTYSQEVKAQAVSLAKKLFNFIDSEARMAKTFFEETVQSAIDGVAQTWLEIEEQ